MSEPLDLNQLAQNIKQWGLELGFQQVGITDTDLSESEPKLQAWLDKQYHGEMDGASRYAARSPSRIIDRYAACDQRADELPSC